MLTKHSNRENPITAMHLGKIFGVAKGPQILGGLSLFRLAEANVDRGDHVYGYGTIGAPVRYLSSKLIPNRRF